MPQRINSCWPTQVRQLLPYPGACCLWTSVVVVLIISRWIVVLYPVGALERLIETLDHRFSGKMDLETRSWVCVALSQCVSGNPETQEKLGSTGIEAIVSVLANMDDLDIKAKAAEALRNVAENEINCIYIATLGGVQQLLEALKIPEVNAVSKACMDSMRTCHVAVAPCLWHLCSAWLSCQTFGSPFPYPSSV